GLTGLRGGDTWGTVSHVQSLFVTLFVKESPHELQAHSEEPGGSGGGDPPRHHRWKPTDRTRTPAGSTARPGRGHRSTVVEGGRCRPRRPEGQGRGGRQGVAEGRRCHRRFSECLASTHRVHQHCCAARPADGG